MTKFLHNGNHEAKYLTFIVMNILQKKETGNKTVDSSPSVVTLSASLCGNAHCVLLPLFTNGIVALRHGPFPFISEQFTIYAKLLRSKVQQDLLTNSKELYITVRLSICAFQNRSPQFDTFMHSGVMVIGVW